jgi:hypothetical protein
MAIETISILDAAGATKLVKADVIGTDYAQVLKVAFGTDGTLTLAETGIGLPVNIENAPTVNQARSSVCTRTSVSASASSVQLLALNTSRKSSTVHNDSSATLYIGCGTAAVSLTDFTYKIAPDGFVEIEYGFTGKLNGIWSSATGSARISEFT